MSTMARKIFFLLFLLLLETCFLVGGFDIIYGHIKNRRNRGLKYVIWDEIIEKNVHKVKD